MKVGILAITAGGKRLAGRLATVLDNAAVLEIRSGVRAAFAANWADYDGFVCIMAAGIVVRGIAPLVRDKGSDPCVVVVDEQGENVISLLSGHLGGGNVLARGVAGLIGGRPVITTASDVLGLPPLDLWVRAQNLIPASRPALTAASARLVNSGTLRLYSEVAVESLPNGIQAVTSVAEADLIVSNRIDRASDGLLLHPRNLVVGIGCNRGTPSAELEEALREFLTVGPFSGLSVRNLASIDLKQDETGLLEMARKNGWEVDFFTRQELNSVAGITPSAVVYKAIGARGVAEPAALLSAATETLLMEKQKWPNVTLALALADFTLSAQVPAA
ncbi:MAG: cobalamin biosynthesis protein [Desulfobacterales bacterium]|nr:cobalamin biosynthesis protein [Desulfobacterales bacterium]